MRNTMLAMTILVCGVKSFAGMVECGKVQSLLSSDKTTGYRAQITRVDKSPLDIYVTGTNAGLVQGAYVSDSFVCMCETSVNGVTATSKPESRDLKIISVGRSEDAIKAALAKEGLGCGD
jgi:hypothetical protein